MWTTPNLDATWCVFRERNWRPMTQWARRLLPGNRLRRQEAVWILCFRGGKRWRFFYVASVDGSLSSLVHENNIWCRDNCQVCANVCNSEVKKKLLKLNGRLRYSVGPSDSVCCRCGAGHGLWFCLLVQCSKRSVSNSSTPFQRCQLQWKASHSLAVWDGYFFCVVVFFSKTSVFFFKCNHTNNSDTSRVRF